MPKFGKRSTELLEECDERIQEVCHEAIKYVDFSVREGRRDEATQNAYYAQGLSQVEYPDSKHNAEPKSKAVHLLPYPWTLPMGSKNPKTQQDIRDTLHLFAGAITMVARQKGIPLVWGGDWDADWETRDNNFDDLMHFELKDEDADESS